MKSPCVNTEIRAILQSARAMEAEKTDGQLLALFVARRDEAAFATLVRRHGPMVLSTCRRLGDPANADDAFQATFLVLVHKATSLTVHTSLANWLYGVARRIALNAKRAAVHRRAKERVAARPEAVSDNACAVEPLSGVDEVLSKLPAIYQLPLILCDMEGRTRKEAAEHLGWPEGTVAGRLARARALMAKRLLRRHRGMLACVASGLVLVERANAVVPASLVQATVQEGMLVSTAVQAVKTALASNSQMLADSVLYDMRIATLKSSMAIVVVTIIIIGIGGLACCVMGEWERPVPSRWDQVHTEPVPSRDMRGGRTETAPKPGAGSLAPAKEIQLSAQEHYSRGSSHFIAGRYDAALADFSKAIELDPWFTDAYLGRATLVARGPQPDHAQAVADLTQALTMKPRLASALYHRASLFVIQQRYDSALADYSAAIDILSKDSVDDTLQGMGMVKLYFQTARHFKVVPAKPPFGRLLTEVHFQRARLYHEYQKNYAAAVADYTKVAELDGRNRREASKYRCLAYYKLREYAKAKADFVAALGSKPDQDQPLLREWVWLLATCPDEHVRDGPKALEYAKRLASPPTENYDRLETLAAAHAECGQFQEAVRSQKQAVEIFAARLREANTASRGEHFQRMQSRLRLYEAGRPYRTD